MAARWIRFTDYMFGVLAHGEQRQYPGGMTVDPRAEGIAPDTVAYMERRGMAVPATNPEEEKDDGQEGA